MTVFGVPTFSSLGRMCCPWWQYHEAAVIKMAHPTEHCAFLEKRFYLSASVIMVQHEFLVKSDNRKPPSRSPLKISTNSKQLEASPTIQRVLCVRRKLSQPQKTYRIVWEDVKLFPNRIQMLQALPEADKSRTVDFCGNFKMLLGENAAALQSIWFSDEAHFH
jgi:hypothetical protein